MIKPILQNRYKIIKRLGSGGFGEIYLAEDLNMSAIYKFQCVVKRLQPEVMNQRIIERFLQEGETLLKLGQDHSQIPKLFNFFEEDQELYLVQEFIEGHDLSQEMTFGKQCRETEVIEFLREILEVLAYVHYHRHIHRDIKPANIMRRFRDGKLILIDFGLVKEINFIGQTPCSVDVGTPGYKPSEQINGTPMFSSDIYAVGMTAIQFLTGIPPHQLSKDNSGEVIWRHLTQVSERLADILTTMLKNNFHERYKDASEALQALIKLQAINLSELYLQSHAASQTNQIKQIAQSDLSLLKPTLIGDKYGYINHREKFIIPPYFDMARDFSHGLAAVNVGGQVSLFFGVIGGKWGYINKRGEWAIVPKFDEASSFSNGVARVEVGGREYYINDRGNLFFS
ncbi:protein kinase domain-containing protein [Nostoc sp.]|uniref:protein kinase domain-containing protein n=1 Tax=Nostoc sp. TaxID=1180 RepID=UPI002FF6E5D3